MKLRSKLFYSYVVFLVLYSGFALLPSPDPAILKQYHVSTLNLRLIDLTIIVMVAAIWFAGFYGYAKLRDYCRLIEGHKDGKQMAKLTRGILLLALWLPVYSVVSVILKYIAVRHHGFLQAATIINNYVDLLLPLLGFIFIGMGARGLSEQVRRRPTYAMANGLVLLILYIGFIYFRLVATTHQRHHVYQMSIWPILLTLVVPYVYMWTVGLLAACEIYIYSRKVAGVVYRKSWRYLAAGIAWLIITSIAFQYLTTLSARLSKLSIQALSAIVYLLLILLAIGFVLIAMGTRKLQKIEEV